MSVIIPAYNAEKYIKSCIESVIKDELYEKEIIVINDGSIDRTQEIVEKFSQKDNRIKLINKENEGSSAARNTGIRNSNGKYILFLDADDFISKNSLKRLVDIAEKEIVDAIIFDIALYKDDGNIRILKDGVFNEKKFITNKEYLINLFLGEGCSSICNKLWNAKLFKENMIEHAETIEFGEDGATLPQLILNCDRMVKINTPLYYYRINLNSKMYSGNIKVYEYIKSYNLVINYFENNKIEWIDKYRFTYKYNHAYSMLHDTFLISKKYKRNEEYRLLYNDFLEDLKDENNIYIPFDSKKGLKNEFLIKAYRKNVYLGEIIKMYQLIIEKLNSIIKI
ncbi:glycosyltransferase family 2 protein [Clostridium sp. 1001271B_151109_B4]|uniref:glycosyltransferase n=1 Tax=Clostridium sp. 1001271B_151109_B4 TaxID=2787148 RepID=UPI0018AC38E7